MDDLQTKVEPPAASASPEPATLPDLRHCAAATRNACKLCTPLGACLVFKGVRGCMPFLHGSQGCATYIRRYLISHFREPMDIAASNFSEDSAVFGGAKNLQVGLRNVQLQYTPELIGLATTCLSETIGEDVPSLIQGARDAVPELPPIVHVSTASYRGSHRDGFHDAVAALVRQLARPCPPHGRIALFPGMVSTADLRHLRELAAAFGLSATFVPDYSDTLDGGTWSDYETLPPGGTPIEEIRALPGGRASLELGCTLATSARTAAAFLADAHRVARYALPLPIGIRHSDAFLDALAEVSGKPIPSELQAERGRLIDALVDGHKVIFGKRVAVYGEADLVIGLVSFLCEIGVEPVLCACGGQVEGFPDLLRGAVPELPADVHIRNGVDFADIASECRELRPDLLLGTSKGYGIARELGVPLVRAGFPIHDRLGGQRLLHLGHRGALRLFDTVANVFLEAKQERSAIGYSYL